MKILDCTLRDGGYYNNWDFEAEVVSAYLDSIARSNVEFVELGLRNFPKHGFLGAFAYTTESFLNTLELPKGPTYGVMVDAKTILDSKLSVEESVHSLFVPAAESKIALVRIAAHFDEVEKSRAVAQTLKNLGYTVGFNLMQAGGKADELISSKARIISEWALIDTLYFADSLGNMDSDEVTRIVKAIKKEWNGELGIHTHNNMGKGLDNTLTALDVGVTWLDVTVTGMGRGAGNTQTESLLAVLDKKITKYNPKPIYELVIRHFEKMQKKYGWGSNLLYFLGAQNNVHPTYIQNLLSNTHYGTDEIVGAIDYLSKLDGTNSYNGAILDTALSFNEHDSLVSGTNAIQSIFDNKNILIVTNGPSTHVYANAIERYISENKPTVISINITESIPSNLIDYYFISHNVKFLSDAKRYQELDKPIILPKHRFLEEELDVLRSCDLLDYGVEIVENKLCSNETFATIPFDITTAYVLAVLLESNPKSVCAVGFDGFDNHDPRQQEMNTILELYSQVESSCDVVSLTPTTYVITQGSIYAPNI